MQYRTDRAVTVSLSALCYCVSAALLFLTLISTAVQAAPAAGSIISNQAEASYHNDASGTDETVYSNTTELVVAAVEGVSLVANLTRTVNAGDAISLPHRLTNAGNITTTYTLASNNLGGNDFNLLNISMLQDLNGNGLADAGEPAIAQGGTVIVAAGANFDLVVTADVPAAASPGQSSMLMTEAVSLSGVTSAAVIDTIDIQPVPDPALSLLADKGTALPGDVVEFTLNAANSGAGAAGPIDVRVDNVDTTLFILRGPVPVNTTYLGITGSGTAQLLYHVAGDALHDYSSIPPANPASVDAVAFGYVNAPAGFSQQTGFNVTLNANAGGIISNQATLYYSNAQDEEIDSNPVLVSLPAATAAIDYYTNASFTSKTVVTRAGDPLFIGMDASACNSDASVVEQHTVTLTTTLSADQELGFVIVETGANTGKFTLGNIPTRAWPAFPSIPGNNTVEVATDDQVSALANCAGISVSSMILIDPAGVVFDSASNQPLAGATVTLFGIDAGGNDFTPVVLDMSGNPAPSQVVTGADGRYEFPLVAAGDYRLDVLAPATHSFPSTLPPASLPAGRDIDASGSYGGTFTVSALSGPVFIDLPLDPGTAQPGLFIEKTASKTVAGLGESVLYTLKISNGTGITLTDTRMVDELPAGFAYQRGTSRLDELRIGDPQGAPGRQLLYQLGTLAPAAEHILQYRVQIRTGALRGDGINSAQLISNAAASNVAKAKVRIADDVFRDEALILGKIFVDCNRDRLQGAEEPGIPGVRIYLDDGTFVVSDVEGKYSFVGISPRTHALKVDATTLPAGAEMITLGNRNAGDPNSLFVDLKKGELHRADFAEGSCTPAIVKQIKQRRLQGEVLVAEVEQQLSHELRADGERPLADPRSRPASGVRDAAGHIVDFVPVFTETSPGPALSNLPATPLRQAASASLESVLPGVEPGLGFIGLRDGDTVAGQQLSIQVKGAAGARLPLLVNNVLIPENRVGQKAVMSSRSVGAWEYVAVKLTPGENRLEVRQLDPFGNKRGSLAITIIAPGNLGKLSLSVPGNGTPADGHTPAPVVVQLQDENDVRVTARTPVTLEATEGRWDVDDLDPREPGIQAFIEGGEAIFDLLPPQQPGEALVRVSSGVLESTVKVSFLPDLRPLIAVGVIEGAIDFSRLDEGDLAPATKQDSFEEQIRELQFGEDDRLRGGVRGSMFLKGKVKGDFLLTLSYDSDKDLKDRLFRDIQPDEFYPVYGDSAIKGFDAQSTSDLYVRLDKGKSYTLYGDYTTQSDSEALRLGNYSRSLTGLRGHYETERVSINYFSSYNDSRQRVIEIPGKGISGPYSIGASEIVRNSEKVEILTRDRNQPALVIETRQQTRFADYTINAIDGTLLFRRPVSSVDENLNPVSIRVAFEVDEGGEDFWIYGFNGQLRLSKNIDVGASFVRDDEPGNNYELYSTNLSVKVGEQGRLLAEIAQSRREVGKTGTAKRIEYRHGGKRLEARLYAADTDKAFDNPTASVTPGRREAGARAVVRIDDHSRLSAEVLYTEDRENGGNRRGADIYIDRDLPFNLRAEVGLRHAKETTAPALPASEGTTPRETNSIRAKLGWQPGFLPQANVSLEYEQDISDSDVKQAAVAGEYQLTDRGRLYLRHEFINSLSGIYGLNADSNSSNTTVLGLDYDYMQDGQLFNEYRLRDAISGREAEASIGLRNLWTIAEGLRIQTGFERIHPLVGDITDEATALTGAIEYTANPLWKGTARLELRRSDATDNLLNTLGYARKLDRDWTALAKNTLTLDRARDSDDLQTRDRMQLGLAYRDTDTNRWQVLSRYEFIYEKDEAIDELRRVHMWSAHANYHPTRPLTLSGRYAGKWVSEDAADYDNDFMAHLLSARVMYDLSERWDLGLIGSTLFMEGFDARQYGLGLEAGYQLTRNLWLSAGYNFFGFKDEDLDEEDVSNPGAYARMRVKFDEEMFNWLQ
ncbi:MAG: carboxypeptidase regulatory-like domain-containing protein [Gammaproteobacteria bacterium]